MPGACKLSQIIPIKNVEITLPSVRSQSVFPWKLELQPLNTCLGLFQLLWTIVAAARGCFSTAQTAHQALLSPETQLPLLLLEGTAGTAFLKQPHSARQSCWHSASVKSIIYIKIDSTGSVLTSYLTFHSSF